MVKEMEPKLVDIKDVFNQGFPPPSATIDRHGGGLASRFLQLCRTILVHSVGFCRVTLLLIYQSCSPGDILMGLTREIQKPTAETLGRIGPCGDRRSPLEHANPSTSTCFNKFNNRPRNHCFKPSKYIRDLHAGKPSFLGGPQRVDALLLTG